MKLIAYSLALGMSYALTVEAEPLECEVVKEHIAEVTFEDSLFGCEFKTKELGIKLSPQRTKGNVRLERLSLIIRDKQNEVVTKYDVQIRGSLVEAKAHTCINEDYVPMSDLVLVFVESKKVLVNQNTNHVLWHSITTKSCPLNYIIENQSTTHR